MCHMWSCRQADGDEEEELMLSTEEKEVQPISFLGQKSVENLEPECDHKVSLSQVSITVIGSDSRKAAAESAFENCRLVVDASVYI